MPCGCVGVRSRQKIVELSTSIVVFSVLKGHASLLASIVIGSTAYTFVCFAALLGLSPTGGVTVCEVRIHEITTSCRLHSMTQNTEALSCTFQTTYIHIYVAYSVLRASRPSNVPGNSVRLLFVRYLLQVRRGRGRQAEHGLCTDIVAFRPWKRAFC